MAYAEKAGVRCKEPLLRGRSSGNQANNQEAKTSRRRVDEPWPKEVCHEGEESEG